MILTRKEPIDTMTVYALSAGKDKCQVSEDKCQVSEDNHEDREKWNISARS